MYWQGGQTIDQPQDRRVDIPKELISPFKFQLPEILSFLSSPNPSALKRKLTLFEKNTGIINGEKEFASFLKEVAEEAQKTNAYLKLFPFLYHHKVNGSIVRDLASSVYKEDTLQRIIVDFKKGWTNDILDANHRHDYFPVDLAHTFTTLASIHSTGIRSDIVKLLFGFLSPSPTNSILQQNSILGDLLTNTDKRDWNSDMDSIILARHPRFKHLPMDKRIMEYYGKVDLEKERMKLFLEVYDSNPTLGRTKFAMELFRTVLTGGGILALGFSIMQSKTIGQVPQNFNSLDNHIFLGGLDQLRKNPLKALGQYIVNLGKDALDGLKRLVDKYNPLSQKNTSLFRQVNKTVVQPVKNIVTSLPKTLYNAGYQVGLQSKKHVTAATKAISTIKQQINRHVVQPARNIVTSLSKTLYNAGRQVGRQAKSYITAATRTLSVINQQNNKKFVYPVKNIAMSLPKTLYNAGRQVGAQVKRHITATTKTISTVKKQINRHVVQPVKNIVTSLPKTLYNAGYQVGAQVKRHITATTRTIKQTVKTVVKQASNIAKSIVKNTRPASKPITRPIQRFVKPIIKSVNKIIKPVSRPVQRVIKPVARTVNRAVASVRKVVQPAPRRVAVKKGRRR